MTITCHRVGRRGTLLAALLSVPLVFAAAVAVPAQETHTVEADNGTIEVPVDPQRVATLGRAGLPFIVLGGKPVGVTAQSDGDIAPLLPEQQAAYRAATIVGARASEADLEALAALAPDLILFSAPDSDFEQMQAHLNAIAPTVFLSFQTDWNVRLDALAAATNRTAVLDAQKAEWRRGVAAFREKYSEFLASTSFAEADRWASQEGGVFVLNWSICSEVARADLGLDIADLGEGGEQLSFEQIGELAAYDVILYPVDHEGNVPARFAPVMETNAWKALPAVQSGRALGAYCNGDRSYQFALQYLDSLDRALATLPAAE
jgi:iron complex transport system substrate-binding protein